MQGSKGGEGRRARRRPDRRPAALTTCHRKVDDVTHSEAHASASSVRVHLLSIRSLDSAEAADALLSYSHCRRPHSQSVRLQLGQLGAMPRPTTLLLRSVSAPDSAATPLALRSSPIATSIFYHHSSPSSSCISASNAILSPIVSNHPSNPDAVLIRPFERM